MLVHSFSTWLWTDELSLSRMASLMSGILSSYTDTLSNESKSRHCDYRWNRPFSYYQIWRANWRVSSCRCLWLAILFNALNKLYIGRVVQLRRLVLYSSYHFNNTLIKQVTTAKYLGITVDKNLYWSEHTKVVVSKANSALGFLRCTLESAHRMLNAYVLKVWCTLYLNMYALYGHRTTNITSAI